MQKKDWDQAIYDRLSEFAPDRDYQVTSEQDWQDDQGFVSALNRLLS